ncbi:MAG: flagellar basal body L-ring protein FlgH [Pirellulales bacterium]
MSPFERTARRAALRIARRTAGCALGIAFAGAVTWPAVGQQPGLIQSRSTQSTMAQPTMAQSGLERPPAPYLTLDNISPYYQEPILPRKLKLHDVVTVVVKESSNYLAEGSVDRRKNGLYDAVLKDWVKLASGLTLKPAAQADGDPKASGTIQQTYRTDSELELRSRIEFRIAATVVDIRPNGNLVLEAHNTFRQDNEVYDASLSGIIRPDDVLPDNTVLSEDVVELSVYKRSKGHVRDGYRRGWLTKVIDTVNPF